MKRPRLIKDRMAHRDALLEALHADALEEILKNGKLPEKARKAIEERVKAVKI